LCKLNAKEALKNDNVLLQCPRMTYVLCRPKDSNRRRIKLLAKRFKQVAEVTDSLPPFVGKKSVALPREDRNEQSRMLTRGATRFSIVEADPSAVVSFK
jgi:hypothetical protein